jgi:hypothetical protein
MDNGESIGPSALSMRATATRTRTSNLFRTIPILCVISVLCTPATACFGQGGYTGPVPPFNVYKRPRPLPSLFLPLHLLSHKPPAGCSGPRSPSITCNSTPLSWTRPDAASASLVAAEYPDLRHRRPRSPTLYLISLDPQMMNLSMDGVELAEIRAQELEPCTCLLSSSHHLHGRDGLVAS